MFQLIARSRNCSQGNCHHSLRDSLGALSILYLSNLLLAKQSDVQVNNLPVHLAGRQWIDTVVCATCFVASFIHSLNEFTIANLSLFCPITVAFPKQFFSVDDLCHQSPGWRTWAQWKSFQLLIENCQAHYSGKLVIQYSKQLGASVCLYGFLACSRLQECTD